MNPMLKRALGIIFAEQHGSNVALFGMKVGSLQSDIMKTWSTSRIEGNMFTTFKANRIEFNAFFAPDVHYILQTLLHRGQSQRLATKARHLREALVSLQEETWLKRLQEEPKAFLDRSKLNLFHKKPLPHQVKFFDVYERNTQLYGLNGYLLSARPGSGKTLSGLMLGEMLHADFIIVISPKNAVHRVWQDACNTEYKKPMPCWVSADGKDYNGERVIIAHYEDLPKVLEIAGKLHGKVMVDLDECHNFNEPESARTKHFIDLCKRVNSNHVIWASGTPIKAMGYEAIPMLRTIDPLFTPDVEQRFRRIFGREAKRALDILRNRMGLLTYKVETLGDERAKPETLDPIKVKLPDGHKYTVEAIKAEMRVFIDQRTKFYQARMGDYRKAFDEMLALHEKTLSTNEQRTAFQKYKDGIKTIVRGYDPVAHKELVKWINHYELKVIMPSLPKERRNEFKSTRSVIKYVQLKIMGEALGGVLGKKRSLVHQEMVEHAHLEQYVNDAETKTLIFSNYVPVVEKIGEYFKGKGFTPILVYGATNANLSPMLTQFERNEKLNPAVATYMSLSTAVPMTMASLAIFFDAPFRDHIMTQAKARLDRLGQTANVQFVHVYLDTGTEPNISTRADEIMNWSKAQVAAIMGDEDLDGMSSGMESEVERYSVESFLEDPDAASRFLSDQYTFQATYR